MNVIELVADTVLTLFDEDDDEWSDEEERPGPAPALAPAPAPAPIALLDLLIRCNLLAHLAAACEKLHEQPLPSASSSTTTTTGKALARSWTLLQTFYLHASPRHVQQLPVADLFRWLGTELTVVPGNETESVELLLSCLWSIGNVEESLATIPLDAIVAPVPTLAHLYQAHPNSASVRTNVLGVLDVYANLLHAQYGAAAPSPVIPLTTVTPLATALSDTVYQIFTMERDPLVLAEAANVLFDLYGPDLFNELFTQTAWLPYLESSRDGDGGWAQILGGGIGGGVSGGQQRNERCQEMYDNLVRFVAYKRG